MPNDDAERADLERAEKHRQEDKARSLMAKAASRTFARLRMNVTGVSPGYVTCSLFQSDNAGTNWGCVGTGVSFPEDWFRETFGGAEQGDRVEFEMTGIHRVTG